MNNRFLMHHFSALKEVGAIILFVAFFSLMSFGQDNYESKEEIQQLLKSEKDKEERSILLCKLAMHEASNSLSDARATLQKARGILKKPSVEVRAHHFKADGYILSSERKFDKSKKSLTRSLELFKKVNDDLQIGFVNYLLGSLHESTREFETAMTYLNVSEKSARKRKDMNLLAMVKQCQGLVHTGQAKYDLAVEDHIETIKIYEGLSNYAGMATCHTNIGACYFYQENIDKALEYFEKGASIKAKHQLSGLDASYLNIAAIYHEKSDFAQSRLYLEKCLEIRLEKNRPEELSQVMSNLGIICKQQGKPRDALSYYSEALNYARIADQGGVMCDILGNMALLYASEKNFDKAIEFAQKTLNKSREIKDREGELFGLETLAQIYEEAGKYKKTIEYLKKAQNLKDELRKLETDVKIEELTTSYELEKSERELAEKRAEVEAGKVKVVKLKNESIKKSGMFWGAIILFGLISIATIIVLRYQRQKRRVVEQARKNQIKGYVRELEALTNQVLVLKNTDHSEKKVDEKLNGFLINPLTKRELDVLALICQGFSNGDIAKKLFVTLSTIKTHNRNIFEKLDVKNRSQAILKVSNIQGA